MSDVFDRVASIEEKIKEQNISLAELTERLTGVADLLDLAQGQQDLQFLELRTRLVTTEEKITHILGAQGLQFNELRERLIHTEDKVGHVLDQNGANCGHPDQTFGGRTYAQHGEDLILANIFHMLGKKTPSYLDVGAHHPVNISNTAYFYQNGSTGVNVEANPYLIENFVKQRPQDINVNVGVSTVAGEAEFYFIDEYSGRNTFDRQTAIDFVKGNPKFKIQAATKLKTMTLNQIVETYCGDIFPDFLSIDVEGLDIPVIESADFSKNAPDVICIEIVNGDDKDISLETTAVLNRKGYGLYCRTVTNGIFIRNDLASKLM